MINFKSKGLIISIIILISLILICHISNYLYNKNIHSSNESSKNEFYNVKLEIPTGNVPTQYNQIKYENKGKLSCNSWQAEIPCNKVDTSACIVPATTKYELTDAEMIDVYKFIYENAGLQVLQRTLKEPKPTPTPKPTKTYNYWYW